MRRSRWLLIAALIVAGYACAHGRSATAHAAEAQPADSAVVLNVTDFYVLTVEVYAVASGTSYRMGTVSPGIVSHFTLRQSLVCLADMPRVGPEVLDRLISALNPLEGRAICVPTWEGKRGNPVLWARRFIPEMVGLAGDVGARHLIGQYGELVAEVPMPDDGVLLDIDTPEALAHLRRRPAPLNSNQ